MDPKVRMPLFDRLSERESLTRADAGPSRTYGKDDLLKSVSREVHHLFNTRCRHTIEAYLDKDLTVLDYGIPDLAHLAAGKPEDLGLTARVLGRALSFFEPRLKEVRVSVFKTGPDASLSRVDAILDVETIREPVTFSAIPFGGVVWDDEEESE